MAGYAVKASYPTVQVLSPTLTNDIEYVTLQTTPSLVIASIPVQRDVFDKGQAGPELTNFSNAIEQVMTMPHVIGGGGTQNLDASGLLQDFVTFIVQYEPPRSAGTSITADADVPVGLLNFTDGAIGQAALQQVEQIITDTYDNLKAMAGTGVTPQGAAPSTAPSELPVVPAQ